MKKKLPFKLTKFIQNSLLKRLRVVFYTKIYFSTTFSLVIKLINFHACILGQLFYWYKLLHWNNETSNLLEKWMGGKRTQNVCKQTNLNSKNEIYKLRVLYESFVVTKTIILITYSSQRPFSIFLVSGTYLNVLNRSIAHTCNG